MVGGFLQLSIKEKPAIVTYGCARVETQESLGWIVSVIFAYAFLWALLYYLTTPGADIQVGAVVLLVLGLVAKASSPIFWKLYKKK